MGSAAGDRQGQGLDVTGGLWDPLQAIVTGRPRAGYGIRCRHRGGSPALHQANKNPRRVKGRG
jgi:hypothetical protein